MYPRSDGESSLVRTGPDFLVPDGPLQCIHVWSGDSQSVSAGADQPPGRAPAPLGHHRWWRHRLHRPGRCRLDPAGRYGGGQSRGAAGNGGPEPTGKAWPPSTIRILPSRPVLLDDRALVAHLIGERLPVAKGAERFTSTY